MGFSGPKLPKVSVPKFVSNPVQGVSDVVNAARDPLKGARQIGSGAGDWFGDVGEKLGFGNKKASEKGKEIQENAGREYGEVSGVLGQMKTGDDAYMNNMGTNVTRYQDAKRPVMEQYYKDLAGYGEEARQASVDATKQWSDTSTRMTDTLDKMKGNAAGAMTLQQSMDPNNAVQQGYRDVYNKEGESQQKLYNDQVGNVSRQGLADAGVLSALGAQATAGQLGGSPVSGAQMQALQGQNQAQSGQAYARAQQQMQRLRDQGLSANTAMRAHGLEAGREESGAAYDRGQQATRDYATGVGQYAGMGQNYRGEMSGYRGERAGYNDAATNARLGDARETMGLGMGVEDTRHSLSTGQGQREIGAINQKYGVTNQGLANMMASDNANQAGKMGFLGTVAGAGIGAIGRGGGSNVAKGGTGESADNGYSMDDYDKRYSRNRTA